LNRGVFLASAAASAAIPSAVAAASPTLPIGAFDRVAFEADLHRPARHKQVFAATSLDHGAVLNYMANSLSGYAEGYGDGPGSMHVAAVLYGFSLVLLLQEEMWVKYRIREGLAALAIPDPVPFPDVPPENPYLGQVAALVAQGASFYVCSHAFGGVTRFLAKRAGFDTQGDAVRNDCLAHLAAGMLVPAGPVGLNAAQEAHFTFFQATMTT